MAAHGCLGAASTVCSTNFVYLFIRPAIAFVKETLRMNNVDFDDSTIPENSNNAQGRKKQQQEVFDDEEEGVFDETGWL
jgi:hypothetical protein